MLEGCARHKMILDFVGEEKLSEAERKGVV